MFRKTLIGLSFLLIPMSVLAYVSPGKPTGFVNDFAQILTAEERRDIEVKLLGLQREAGFEVAVVTVTSLGDETVESYAVKLFEEWGIGDADQDTGILVLVAPTDRVARIETGYGAEGAVTDIQAGNIIRTVMVPAFAEGNYGAGISGTVDALGLIVTDSPEAAKYLLEGSAGARNDSSGGDFDLAGLFFLVIIFLNGFARILGKTKSWWLGGVIGAGIGTVVGLIWGFLWIGLGSIIGLTILGLIFDFIVSRRPPGSGGAGGFWPLFFGGGGHGGGGFGGFGGGMSGGGGASGRW